MKTIYELRDDPKIAAAATDTPEKVRVCFFVDFASYAIGGRESDLSVWSFR